MTTRKQLAERIVEDLVEAGTKRIKLGITDIDGVLRGKYLTMEKFASLATSHAGFCDCIFGWDVADQLYDNVTFSSWDKGFPDAPYRLDLSTRRDLPDEPHTPFFLGELVPPEGERFHPVCPRNLLARVLADAEDMGFAVDAGFEYEFFLFDETPASAREKGYRNLRPFTPGMFGYSVLRTSVHADLHQAFLDYCEDLKLGLEGYHTETGPGVMEACLRVAPGLEAADKAVLFKTFTKVFFERRNLMATFMARWSERYPGQSGHFHVSLRDAASGQRLFHDPAGRAGMSRTMEAFVAGQLRYMPELCAMVAPTVNAYTRLVEGAWAPTAATWGIDNRTTALRIVPGDEKSQRVEYRLAAADANPYLVAAAAIASGLEGIRQGLALPPPVEGNAYAVQNDLPADVRLPPTLRVAAERLAASDFARRAFSDAFVEHFAATRLWETRQFERAVTDWELARYFEII
ncbi:MAG: glutamine synthetase [Deltaproteobacteria bacterium]|nr:MAG: glutamine synthetase [Deltaproteobacteria bacterium]